MNSVWISLDAIANGLCFSSLIAVALVGFGSGLNRLFANSSASFRHSIWLAISICVLATPVASLWIPGVLPRATLSSQFAASVIQSEEVGTVISNSQMDIKLNSGEPPKHEPVSLPETGPRADLNQGASSTVAERLATLSTRKSEVQHFYHWFVCIWIAGMIIFMCRIWQARKKLASAFHQNDESIGESLSPVVHRLAREHGLSVISCVNPSATVRGLDPRTIALTISKSDAGPLIWGFMPARLLIPMSLDQLPCEAQEAAIRHEFAHVARGDEWVRRYLLVLRTLFWFHPLVRYNCDQVQLFAEKACDDQVLRLGYKPSLYSSLLLHLGQRQRMIDPAFQTSGMAQSQIASRINSVLKADVSRRPMSWGGVIAVTVTLFLFTSAVSALRPSNSAGTGARASFQDTHNPKPGEVPRLNVGAKDWPQWGGSSARNNTPGQGNIPLEWDIKKGKNVRWSMRLGSDSYGGTVVANGKVFVGTNNGAAYLKRLPSNVDLGVLLCFNELDGEFLWQHSNNKLPTGRVHDWPTLGICSAPLVDGNRLWYVTNRGEVVCLDTEGFRDGENDGPFVQEEVTVENEADVVWVFDMMKQLNVSQHNMANCSVTCAGDMLFVNTSEGVGESHADEGKEHAPSFLCLSRATGSVLWTDSSPGNNILHGQWSSPAYGVLGGTAQVIFGGGDGYLYGFLAEGESGKSKLLWKFDCNPKNSKYQLSAGTRNHVVATPVIYNSLVYIAVGEDPEHGDGNGHLWCVDPTKRGDVSPTLVYNSKSPTEPIAHKRRQALDAAVGDFEKPNPNSAEVWHYVGLNPSVFEQTMHRTCSTVAIQKDLLFVPDLSGLFHCLDARTGKAHWIYDMFAACWASPLIVDDRVYICDEDGDVAVFQLSDTMSLLKEQNLGSAIYNTPIVANDTLFIAARDRVIAIQEGTQSKPLW